MSPQPHEELTRRIDAPVARVSRAFSEPRQLEAWLFHEPSTRGVQCLRLEPRVGGLFRLRYRRQTELMPVEHHYVSFGAFEEYAATHLSFGCALLQLYPIEGSSVVGRFQVRVALEGLGAKTRVRLVSQTAGPTREGPRWSLSLDALERLLTGPVQAPPAARFGGALSSTL